MLYWSDPPQMRDRGLGVVVSRPGIFIKLGCRGFGRNRIANLRRDRERLEELHGLWEKPEAFADKQRRGKGRE